MNTILSNRYKLESEIGRGGMGVVYRAEDMQVKRTVAIKTLPAVMTHNQELMKRFNAEVQNASRLEHPNIARVFDVGEDGGTHYYVMQYIDGSDLRVELNKQGRFSVDETIRIISQVAGALDYAHSQGIVHRDIKPENILLDKEGNAHVVDFGIAKATEGTRTTRGMLGTPEYMSPEQVKGKSVDGRSDQYSLATVAYEMLTGATPFKTEGDDPWAQINMHLNTPVPNPKATFPDIPTHVANALLQALAKKPEQRFGSCAELVGALKGEVLAMVEEKSSAWSTTVWIRHRILLTAVIVGISISVLSMELYLSPPNSEHRSPSLSLHSKQATSIAYVDLSNSSLDALCVTNSDGINPKRIAWFNGPHYRIDDKDNPIHVLVSANCTTLAYETETGISIMDCVTGKTSTFDAGKLKGLGVKSGELLAISPNGDDILIMSNALFILKWRRPEVIAICEFPLSSFGKTNWGRPSLYFVVPTYSPDGRMIAFASPDGNLYLVDANGKRKRQLANIGAREWWEHSKLHFAIDGSVLVFNTYQTINYIGRPESPKLLAVDVQTGRVRMLLPKSMNIKTIDVLAVFGQKVLFTTIQEGRTIVYSVDVNGGDIRQVAVVSDISLVSVSPDCKTALGVKGYQTVVLDLASGKSKSVFIGRPLQWVSISSHVGESISKPNMTTPHLPQGYAIVKKLTTDLDDDGVVETVTLAANSTGDRLSCWVDKGSKRIWTLPPNDVKVKYEKDIYRELPSSGQSRVKVDIKYLTGDTVPSICIWFVWDDRIDRFLAYRSCDGSFVNIIGDIVGEYRSDLLYREFGRREPIEIAVWDGRNGNQMGYVRFHWNGKNFARYAFDITDSQNKEFKPFHSLSRESDLHQ